MEALNEALLEPTNGASRESDGAAPVRLEWAGVGVVAGQCSRAARRSPPPCYPRETHSSVASSSTQTSKMLRRVGAA